jgi:3-dehydroquinate synthase
MYGERVRNILEKIGPPVNTVFVPDGETYKNLREVDRVYNFLVDYGVDRNGLILSLGGGVIGDLAGFVAATYLRGIRFAQITTTLLSAVDASVGGKVAVNLSKGKNMVGCFHQPEFIVTDVSFLQSLTERNYLAGVAEVIKHGLIGDPKLFDVLDGNIAYIKARQEKLVEFMIERSIRYKSRVVAKDERESGPRAVLNFGHTVGHAIESVMNYTGINHGEAVAIGTLSALFLSQKLKKFPQRDVERSVNMIQELGLPTWIRSISVDNIVEHLRYDKKRHKSKLNFVLLNKVGSPEYGVDVPIDTIKQVLIYQRRRFNQE